MILIVGGSNQGKLQWALQNFGYTRAQVLDGAKLDLRPGQPLPLADCKVLWHLETLLRQVMQREWPAEELSALAAAPAKYWRLPEDAVIICNSVGGGLVPVERFEREWRELVGRTCCSLAAEAGQVWRIFCGLPQRLK